MSVMRDEPIGISNTNFFIANIMRDCPAHTVIRELLQNAMENSGAGRIEWFAFNWDGTLKLGLYNEGPGMGYTDLKDLMNMASSGKTLGTSDNYGQGAKMSGAKASPYGLVYRSCKDGEVNQIILRVVDLEDGEQVLVKVAQGDTSTGETDTVIDVTDDAILRGRVIDREWTEAILLGRSAEDNTLTGRFLGESRTSWLSEKIIQRYYRFPDGVVVHNATVTSNRREEEHRNARTLSSVVYSRALTERFEEVQVSHPFLGPLRLVYGKINKSTDLVGGSLWVAGLSRGTHACLVWKDEVYDLDLKWFHRGGAYGFPMHQEDYFIQMIIADDAPVRNNNHRTQIVARTKDSEAITCTDLATIVRECRPQWIIDEMTAFARNEPSKRLEDRIKRLAEKLRAKLPLPPITPGIGGEEGFLEVGPNQHHSGGSRDGKWNTPSEGGPFTKRGTGTPSKKRPRPEQVMALFKDRDTDPAWCDDMQGKAGAYERELNMVWLSREFDEYRRLKQAVDSAWTSPEDHQIAMRILDEEYRYRATVFAMNALWFRGKSGWTSDEWEKALTIESISAVMGDGDEEMERRVRYEVGRQLTQRLRTQQQEALAHA